MAKSSIDLTNFDAFKFKGSTEELQEIRRTLAKRSNQRLVRLERAVSNVTGEQYSAYGAAQNVYDYILEQKDDFATQLRFRETLKPKGMTRRELKKEITVMQKFLRAKSSTVGGQRAIEKKRLKTFSSGAWGTGGHQVGFIANKDFFDFLNSATYEQLVASGFTSEDIVDMYTRNANTLTDEQIAEKFSNALDDYQAGKAKASIKDLQSRFPSSSTEVKKVRGGQNNAPRRNKKV